MVLATSMLVQIEFSAASAADAAIHKNALGTRAFGSGAVTLIVSKEEIRDIMKTVRYL